MKVLSSPLVFQRLVVDARSFEFACCRIQSVNALLSLSEASFGKPSIERTIGMLVLHLLVVWHVAGAHWREHATLHHS